MLTKCKRRVQIPPEPCPAASGGLAEVSQISISVCDDVVMIFFLLHFFASILSGVLASCLGVEVGSQEGAVPTVDRGEPVFAACPLLRAGMGEKNIAHNIIQHLSRFTLGHIHSRAHIYTSQ